METLLIRPQDIAEVVKQVGLDSLMDRMMASLIEAFKEVNRGQQLQPEEVGPSLMEMIERPEEFYHWRERQTVFDSTGLAIEDHVALSILQFSVG